MLPEPPPPDLHQAIRALLLAARTQVWQTVKTAMVQTQGGKEKSHISKLDAKDWDVFRAMLAAENGLMAIKLGGSGDMTATAVKWQYLRPVPQVPSTVLYQGVLYMVNDSGILLSFDPATGNILKQGRLKGAIDKYFASPIGADGKIWLASQDGTISIVTAKGDWEMVQVNTLDDEVFATPIPADGELFVRTRSALYNFVK